MFSVTANQATLDLSDDTVASFAITNGVATDSYKYTVTSSGGSGTVTGSGSAELHQPAGRQCKRLLAAQRDPDV